MDRKISGLSNSDTGKLQGESSVKSATILLCISHMNSVEVSSRVCREQRQRRSSSTGFSSCGKNTSFLFHRLPNRRFFAIREICLLVPGSRLLPFSLFGSRLGTSLRPQAGLVINFTKRTKFEAA